MATEISTNYIDQIKDRSGFHADGWGVYRLWMENNGQFTYVSELVGGGIIVSEPSATQLRELVSHLGL